MDIKYEVPWGKFISEVLKTGLSLDILKLFKSADFDNKNQITTKNSVKTRNVHITLHSLIFEKSYLSVEFVSNNEKEIVSFKDCEVHVYTKLPISVQRDLIGRKLSEFIEFDQFVKNGTGLESHLDGKITGIKDTDEDKTIFIVYRGPNNDPLYIDGLSTKEIQSIIAKHTEES